MVTSRIPMDFCDQIQAYFDHLPGVADWPDMALIFNHRAGHHPTHWQIPAKACLAVGGNLDQSFLISTILACLHTSIVLIDGLLDEENPITNIKTTPPQRANLAAAFQAIGIQGITTGDFTDEIKQALVKSLSAMLFSTALGQSWDIQNPSTEEEYWKFTRQKSSPFFSSAFECGSLIILGETDLTRNLSRLGSLYGEIIQIHDDLADSLSSKNTNDWLTSRSPLPILFAETVNHPDRIRFLELRSRIPSPGALKEAQTILIRCGAVSYCIDQLIQRYKRAQSELGSLSLPHPDILAALLEKTISPVRSLLATLGLPDSLD